MLVSWQSQPRSVAGQPPAGKGDAARMLRFSATEEGAILVLSLEVIEMRMRIWYGKLKGAIADIDMDCTRILFQVFNDKDESQGIMEADFGDLPDLIQAQVSLYGLNKLLSDRTSVHTDKLEKLDAMHEVLEQLMSGTWAKERVVGAMITGVAVEALAQLRDMSIPQVQAALAAYDKDKREQILGNDAVVKLAAEIKAARDQQELENFDDLL